MGFLAPLYALAALAIIGPIVFHLIQRKPRGERVFSSLMFLSPSPPTLTRRSRLDNLPLLLLRALVIGLIAFAFARPYWRANSSLNSTLSGRKIALVLDTSASMQRVEVWQAAVVAAEQLLDELSPADRVGLYGMDDRLQPLVPLEDTAATDPVETVRAVRNELGRMRPGWRASEVASGLKSMADTMSAAMLAGDAQDPLDNQIVLISDLHEESGLAGLQGYPWPENVGLDVRQVSPSIPGNARATLVRSAENEDLSEASDALKVRVENNADSLDQLFQLSWQTEAGEVAAEPMQVQVPPGQSRVVTVAAQPSTASRLVLSGDPWEADNTLIVATPLATAGTIAFVGPDRNAPENRLDYFLQQAPLGTLSRARTVERIAETDFPARLAGGEIDAVVYEPTNYNSAFAAALKEYVAQGGTALIVLSQPWQASERIDEVLRELTGIEAISLSEAPPRNFALLSAIDYAHPVFAPFADPRFNDFSKLRFWSHRVLQGLTPTSTATSTGEAARSTNIPPLDAQQPALRVIASFDDLTPFLLEQPLGPGRLWIATAGWQPQGSNLALSSKFVPIISQILDPQRGAQALDQAFEVGQAIDVSNLVTADSAVLFDESGRQLAEYEYELRGGSLRVNQPGLVRLTADGRSWPLAVHVPLRESQLEPIDLSLFEQYGVALGRVAADVDRRETERQRSATELENQQRIWQWLVAAGLLLLAIETLAAGLLARRKQSSLSYSRV